jgi:hypothetical protein
MMEMIGYEFEMIVVLTDAIDFIVAMSEHESEKIDLMMKMIDCEFEMIGSALQLMPTEPKIHNLISRLPFRHVLLHLSRVSFS